MKILNQFSLTVAATLLTLSLPTWGRDQGSDGVAPMPPLSASHPMVLHRGINIKAWFTNLPSSLNLIGVSEVSSIRKLGFDFVRLPLDPRFFMTHDGSLDFTYIDSLDRALNDLTAVGLKVIIDLHPVGTSEQTLERPLMEGDEIVLARYSRFVAELAGHISVRHPQDVALELLNEPYAPAPDGCLDSQWDYNPIQERLWRAARSTSTLTLILTGGCWSQVEWLPRLRPVPDTNVIYTVHVYAPLMFTHQGAKWMPSLYHFLKSLPYPSNPENVAAVFDANVENMPDEKLKDVARGALQQYGERRWDQQRLRALLSQAREWSRQNADAALLLGEFGVYRPHLEADARARWIRDMRESAEQLNIPWAMWEYSGAFGLFENGRLDPAIVKALGLSLPQ